MSSKIMIGWASRDVTPDRPVNLCGQFHMRITDKVRDPVIVTSLALSDDREDVRSSFIWVACDTVSIADELYRLSRERLKERLPDFPPENLILNATHTHTAPDHRLDGWHYVPEGAMTQAEYLAFFAGRIAEAAEESWRKRKPGYLGWGIGYAPIGHGRRAIYFDDLSKRPDFKEIPGMKTERNARMYGDTSDDKFDCIEGYADHSAHFLFAFDENKRLSGAVVNVACPAQETESLNEISADFWHETRTEIRKRHGENLFVLPQCSAAGNLSPHLMFNKKACQRMLELRGISSRQAIAERISAAFDETLSWASKDLHSSVEMAHVVRKMQLPRRKISEQEYLKVKGWLKQLEGMTPIPGDYLGSESVIYARKKRCQAIIDRYEKHDSLGGYEMELHVLRLGDIAFATNSFELFTDFGIRIQARSPALQTFVVQHVGKGTYLPTRLAQQGESYSACMFCNQVGPEAGDMIVEETLRIIKDLWSSSPGQNPQGG